MIFHSLPSGDAVRKQKKNNLEGLFSSVLSQFQKYHPSENLKCNYLGIFQSLSLTLDSQALEWRVRFVTQTWIKI